MPLTNPQKSAINIIEVRDYIELTITSFNLNSNSSIAIASLTSFLNMACS